LCSSVTTIGFIGSGNIGTAVAGLAIAAGHDVVLSNSRGPETLSEVIAGLGPKASAGTAEEAAERGDIVVVTIPFRAYRSVPVAPLAGKVVIDTNNYYPQRDGNVAGIDDGTATSAGLLQAHLPQSSVVKAFNHIRSGELSVDGRPSGSPDRRALAIAGDDLDAKKTVTDLLDSFGYDVVDAGSLADSWRFEPGHPAYGPSLTAPAMTDALAAATRTTG
jgi:predicted dinucleotide-binding enzyme